MGYIGNQIFTGVITSSDTSYAGVIEITDLSASAQAQLVLLSHMVLQKQMDLEIKKRI